MTYWSRLNEFQRTYVVFNALDSTVLILSATIGLTFLALIWLELRKQRKR